MKRKSLSLIAVLLVSVILLTACGESSKSENIDGDTNSKEKLVIGMEAGYAPFNWTQKDDSNGAVKIEGTNEFAGGYDVEMAKLIAEELDRELVIEKIEWEGLLPALQSGMIDIIMAGMSPTEERMKQIDFTDNYYTSDLIMVVREDSEFANAKSIQDFEGAKVVGQLNTFHDTVIDQIDGVIHEVPMEDFPTMRVALQSGIIDGYVSERPEGISATSVIEEFKMIEFEDGFEASDDDVSIAVGVKKDSDLTKIINEILSNISDEQRQEIMDEVIVNQPSSEE